MECTVVLHEAHGLCLWASVMKYVIIIPDGGADHPLKELEGQTAFEAAVIPYTDRISIEGRQGTAVTTPAGFPCGSDVCSLCLLGYDPVRYHKGRAPLEAEALGLQMSPSDWVFRINLITVVDGGFADHSAGAIPSEQGAQLLADVSRELNLPDQRLELFPGVSYRNIMIDRSGERNWSALETTPPHDVPGQVVCRHMPTGCPDAQVLCDLITNSAAVLAEHPINRARRDNGQLPATHLWPRGQGRRPQMDSFESRFRLRGAIITAVDLLAGIAGFIGWDRLDVPGQSSYHEQNDYAAAAKHAIDALDRYDIVCAHFECPDEASHAADAATKVKSIEAIDQHVVSPMLEHLHQRGEPWRVLYLPDHYTSVATRKHDDTPVPLAMCGHRITSVLQKPFNEHNSDESDMHIEYGHELMEYFLRGSQA